MRMRTLAAAAAAACGLVALFAAAGPAAAATGGFGYVYDAPDGTAHQGLLLDPPNGVCLTLPEVAVPWTPAAHSPRNDTDARALVFSEAGCQGLSFALRPLGGHASDRLKVRSVLFG